MQERIHTKLSKRRYVDQSAGQLAPKCMVCLFELQHFLFVGTKGFYYHGQLDLIKSFRCPCVILHDLFSMFAKMHKK